MKLPPKPVTNILVATDFSDAASHAVDFATRLALALEAPLHIVHAYTPVTFVAPDGLVLAPVFDDAQVKHALARSLEGLADSARQRGVHAVESQLLVGPASSEILHAAEARHCDLIVISTHGRGGVPRMVLGSVADKVVRKATCPVLTIGPRA
jgi:nucleotide-binding universal stress UspA family protein